MDDADMSDVDIPDDNDPIRSPPRRRVRSHGGAPDTVENLRRAAADASIWPSGHPVLWNSAIDGEDRQIRSLNAHRIPLPFSGGLDEHFWWQRRRRGRRFGPYNLSGYGDYRRSRKITRKRRVSRKRTSKMAKRKYASRRYSRKRSGRGRISYTPGITTPNLYIEALKAQRSSTTKRGSDHSRARYGRSMGTATDAQMTNRLTDGFYGRGDYKRWIPRVLGGAAGYLSGAGFKRGWNAGGDFSKNILGWGDYSADAPVANQLIEGGSQPLTVNASPDLKGDIIFSHREFVGNVAALVPASGLSAFNVMNYPINPGIGGTFPFLAQLAQCFTLYQFEGLVFEYKPTSGEYGSTSNQLGKIIMATQYDPDASSFTSSVQMENYDYSTSCKPSVPMVHGVETDPKSGALENLYVRTGVTSKDKVFTDIGSFQIATEGLPVTGTAGTYQNVGELWVSYKIRLSRAQLFETLGSGIGCDYFLAFSDASTMVGGTSAYMTTTNTATMNYYNLPAAIGGFSAGQVAAAKKTNNIGALLQSGSMNGLVLKFPANIVQGTFRVRTWIMYAAAGSSTSPSAPSGFKNASLVTNSTVTGYTNQLVAPVTGDITKVKMSEFVVSVSAPGNNIAECQINWDASVVSGALTLVLIEETNAVNVIGS